VILTSATRGCILTKYDPLQKSKKLKPSRFILLEEKYEKCVSKTSNYQKQNRAKNK